MNYGKNIFFILSIFCSFIKKGGQKDTFSVDFVAYNNVIKNLLNIRHIGIVAYNGIDDDYVHPQTGTRFQSGVRYRMGRSSVLK